MISTSGSTAQEGAWTRDDYEFEVKALHPAMPAEEAVFVRRCKE